MQYNLNNSCEEELLKIFSIIYKNKDNNFSNARFVRKAFDGVQLSQTKRIFENNLCNIDALMQITLEDIKTLYTDEDFNSLLNI